MKTTTILYMRHEVHGEDGAIKQELPPSARERARARGRELEKLFPIDAAYSSPMPRALDTVLQTLTGYGKLIPIRTDDRLGDLAMGGVDPAPIKKVAKKLGMEPEDLCLMPEEVSPEFESIMLQRAREGAECLRGIAIAHAGQTVIVGSHGGSRMEVSILGLKATRLDVFFQKLADLDKPLKMLNRGQIVALIINSETGELVTEEYLNL